MKALDFHVERRFLSRSECADILRWPHGPVELGRTAGKGAKRNCWTATLVAEDVNAHFVHDCVLFESRIKRLMRVAYPNIARGYMTLEPIQLVAYPADLNGGGSYTWHMDRGRYRESPIAGRRMSISIQLSDSKAYQGGDLQFNLGDVYDAPREIGSAIVFPSYVLHQVTPVRRGLRHALVTWLGE